MTPLEMRDHIVALANGRGIDVMWSHIPRRLDEFNAFASPGLIEVYNPTATEGTEFTPAAAYFTALHELGHHYRGHVDLPRGPMSYRDRLLARDVGSSAWYALGPGGPTYDTLRQRIREAYSAVPDLAVAA